MSSAFRPFAYRAIRPRVIPKLPVRPRIGPNALTLRAARQASSGSGKRARTPSPSSFTRTPLQRATTSPAARPNRSAASTPSWWPFLNLSTVEPERSKNATASVEEVALNDLRRFFISRATDGSERTRIRCFTASLRLSPQDCFEVCRFRDRYIQSGAPRVHLRGLCQRTYLEDAPRSHARHRGRDIRRGTRRFPNA